MSLVDKAKDLLLRINKSSDLIGDLDKKVLRMQTKTPLDPYKKRDIIELIKATDNKKDNIANIMDQITKEMAGATPARSRISSYDCMRDIKKKMPLLMRATRIWVDNILSPDDINKRALRVAIDDETEIKKEEYADLIREFRDYVKFLQLEKKADSIITKSLLEGDTFLEITTQKRMFNTALKMNNIQLRDEESIKLRNVISTANIQFIETPELASDTKDISLRIHEDSLFDDYALKLLEADDKKEEDKKEEKKDDKKEDKKTKPRKFPKKDDDDEKDDKENDNELRPEIYEKLPDQTFDLRIAQNDKDNLAIQDIVLQPLDPKKIIILHKNDWVMGYLYIDTPATNVQDREKFPEERAPSEMLLKKLFIQVRQYLSQKDIDEIPEELHEIITKVLMNSPDQQVTVRFIPINNIQHFKNPSIENEPYGESYYVDLLFIIKLYLARLTSSTLYRIARTGKHLVFYIDVTNTHDARKRIESVKKSVKKREITVDSLGTMDAVPTIMSTFEDFYIPTKGGQRMVDIESLELGNMDDVANSDTFFLKNILTGIEIPPSYLGVEEFNSTKATLSQESMIFARSIIRLQKIFSEQFTELLHKIYRIIHKSKLNNLYLNMICTFAPPSAINVENVSSYYNKIRGLYTDLTEMGLPEDYVRRRWLPEIEWDTIMLEELQRKKEDKDAEMGETGFDNPFGGGDEFGDLGRGENPFDTSGGAEGSGAESNPFNTGVAQQQQQSQNPFGG